MTDRFPHGRLLMSRGVCDSIPMDEVITSLVRHLRGDWGSVCAEDSDANEMALREGSRLLSAYVTSKGKVWIITESDRSATTVLLPDEY